MHPLALRARLNDATPLLLPGVYDALSAELAAQAGFEGVYLSGASIAYTRLAAPDIGLVTMTETQDVLACIRQRITLPIVVDGDTGFGNALGVQRTMRGFERAGATAVQLEDQAFPKRCGHLAEKRLISASEMAGKVRAACEAREHALVIARTDAIAVEGLDSAFARAEAYLEAGADVLFIEAPQDQAQLVAIAQRFAGRAKLLANMVEGGRTPIASAAELGEIGYDIVIFPGGTVRAVALHLRDYFTSLREHGTTAPFRNRMLDFDGLNAMIGTPGILEAARAFDPEG